MRKKPRHLRLVGSNDTIDPGDPFADLENARYRPLPELEVAPLQLRRHPGRLFAQIELDWIATPPLRRLMPPELRLYLVLQIRTRRGARMVRLTNAMAAEAGLDRFQKSKCLRELEDGGLVEVVREGNRNPEVTWLPPTVSAP